jgi:hypothetical protein
MLKRSIPWLLGAALLTFVPARVLAQNCGPFSDVLASDPFCPYILQAFNNGITSGTSATTFSPSNTVTRDQMVVFFDKGVDLALHRGTVRTAMGKTWAPTSTNGAAVTDVGGAINDIVTDGINLWMARADSKILKVSSAERRVLETWTIPTGSPRKLGIFAGLVWIADNLGNLYAFNPAGPAGAASPVLTNGTAAGNYPTLAFDGTNVWWANAASANIVIIPLGNPTASAFSAPANVDGMVFDGTYMWVLLANSILAKTPPPTAATPVPTPVEALTIPTAVNACKMLYDGSNIWFASGVAGTGTLYVVHPTTVNPSVLPSSIILNTTVPTVSFPYATAFDGENVMIGGLNNGAVAVYKATTQTLIGAFATGASSVLGIASEGRTFNFGDAGGTKFFQY